MEGGKKKHLAFARIIGTGANQREFTISKADATVNWLNIKLRKYVNICTVLALGSSTMLRLLDKWMHKFSKPTKANIKLAERENNNEKAHRKTYRIQVYTLKETDCEVCQAPQNIDVQAGFLSQTDTVSHFYLRQNFKIYSHPKTISDI